MIIESIFEALVAQYNASPLPAWVEGFYYGQAPQDTTGDYITYFQVSGKQEYTMSSQSEHPLIQISVWSDDDAPAMAIRIAEIVMMWFDDATLDVSMGQTIRVDRESHNLIRDPDGGWQYQIDYSILVQED